MTLERLEQPVAILLAYAAQRLGARRLAKRLHREKQRARRVFQGQQPGPPIGRVLPALDQAAFREPVENAHQGDRLDVEQFGEAGLMDALVLREIGDGLPLRTGQAWMSGPLFEFACAGGGRPHAGESQALDVDPS